MTNQELFNYGVVHLLYQQVPSYNPNKGASFRTRDNNGNVLKCIIGALIPDELYSEEIEIGGRLFGYHFGLFPGKSDFLINLQNLHDQFCCGTSYQEPVFIVSNKHWTNSVIRFANEFDLDCQWFENFINTTKH